MTLENTLKTLTELTQYMYTGGKNYKTVQRMLQREATTHNLEEAEKLLEELQSKD